MFWRSLISRSRRQLMGWQQVAYSGTKLLYQPDPQQVVYIIPVKTFWADWPWSLRHARDDSIWLAPAAGVSWSSRGLWSPGHAWQREQALLHQFIGHNMIVRQNQHRGDSEWAPLCTSAHLKIWSELVVVYSGALSWFSVLGGAPKPWNGVQPIIGSEWTKEQNVQANVTYRSCYFVWLPDAWLKVAALSNQTSHPPFSERLPTKYDVPLSAPAIPSSRMTIRDDFAPCLSLFGHFCLILPLLEDSTAQRKWKNEQSINSMSGPAKSLPVPLWDR